MHVKGSGFQRLTVLVTVPDMVDELIAGRYSLEEELGKGASATVYRATDTALNRPVALKVMTGVSLNDAQFIERFTQEARLAARLHHANVMTVHDAGSMPDGRPFISMRLLEGRPLDAIVEQESPVQPERVAAITLQLWKRGATFVTTIRFERPASVPMRATRPVRPKCRFDTWSASTPSSARAAT